ncbi:MAG: dTDP-4-dehydrorhamnose 3,5-epimerase [Ramlibacter sp.]
MKSTPLGIEGVLLIEPRVFEDERGSFYESHNEKRFSDAVGRPVHFVQDNHSTSHRHVLRGLHYQVVQPQGKLVRVLAGAIFDVAVDARSNSATFGLWVGEVLSSSNRRQLWIPEGFAHGFLVLGETAEVLYKTTDYYSPEHERCIVWNDSTLSIDWPLNGVMPTVSSRDAAGTRFPGPSN